MEVGDKKRIAQKYIITLKGHIKLYITQVQLIISTKKNPPASLTGIFQFNEFISTRQSFNLYKLHTQNK
jgi:hypothetical protein